MFCLVSEKNLENLGFDKSETEKKDSELEREGFQEFRRFSCQKQAKTSKNISELKTV